VIVLFTYLYVHHSRHYLAAFSWPKQQVYITFSKGSKLFLEREASKLVNTWDLSRLKLSTHLIVAQRYQLWEESPAHYRFYNSSP
jgi:hypothetical protein